MRDSVRLLVASAMVFGMVPELHASAALAASRAAGQGRVIAIPGAALRMNISNPLVGLRRQTLIAPTLKGSLTPTAASFSLCVPSIPTRSSPSVTNR